MKEFNNIQNSELIMNPAKCFKFSYEELAKQRAEYENDNLGGF